MLLFGWPWPSAQTALFDQLIWPYCSLPVSTAVPNTAETTSPLIVPFAGDLRACETRIARETAVLPSKSQRMVRKLRRTRGVRVR